MNCEICGKELGRKLSIEMEGMELVVCEDCSSFGTEIEQPEPVAAKKKKARSAGKAGWDRGPELDLGLDVVADYGTAIKKARQKKSLTVEELAKNIFEKASTLHRVESQALAPSNELIQKLEKELGINLKEQMPSELENKEEKQDSEKKFTIADLAWKKKKV